MKVAIKVSKLQEVLSIASNFVSKNSVLPILQNIYMKASIDEVIIRATDMEKYVEIKIPTNIQVEWAITVNAKMFFDIVSTMDDDEVEISVDQQTQVMNIRGWKDNFDINWISANEYVALPEVPQENSISLEANQLSDGIKKVEYSVTEKNFSPVLTWILLKWKDGNSLVCVWTDSFRLTEYKVSAENIWDFNVIIPKVAINDIKRIADYAITKETGEIKMNYSDNLIVFEFQIWDINILATSLLIQGTFPDYEKPEIMPTEFNSEIIVDKSQFEKAIKKIWILTKDINNFIHIEVSTDEITVSSWKTDKWKWKTNIPAIVKWNPIGFWVNWRYITDFIKSVESENIALNVIDWQKPILIQDQSQLNYKYIVRPLVN